MKTTTEVTMESILVSALNVAAVYMAAFTYKMNWTGIMTVMVLASLCCTCIIHCCTHYSHLSLQPTRSPWHLPPIWYAYRIHSPSFCLKIEYKH